MTTITPADTWANDLSLGARAAVELDALPGEYVMEPGDSAEWCDRAERVWRVLMVKSAAERRAEWLAIAPPMLRERLESWLAEYGRLYRADRKAWAAFAAPTWRVVLSCSDPGPKRELWARMDTELKAALKALAEQPELEKAA